MSLEQMIAPVADEFERYRETYRNTLVCRNELLGRMLAHALSGTGKQMRPLFTILCAKMMGGITEATLHGACALELLHLSSLVHDDVVDNSDERRGKPSLKACFDNKAAVLGGDYILSSALIEATATNNLEVMHCIASLGNSLIEGEILQLQCQNERHFSETNYFEVIKNKTASLFATCAQIGLLTSISPNRSALQAVKSLGERLGVCFQLKDDLFDYFPSTALGKPTGNDIREGKMTLPLLYVYEQADAYRQAQILQAFSNAEVGYLQNLVQSQGGIAYTEQKLQENQTEAHKILEGFADSPARKALEQFTDYLSTRSK